MKVLVAGDFSQKNRIDEVVRNNHYGLLFDDIRNIVYSADYSLVNFEFPIILRGTRPEPINKNGPNLKGTTEAVDAVKYAGFKCCTLANNHILDQGEQCCVDTRNQLEGNGIDTVGAGANLNDAERILYKSINGETIAIINCCEHEFSIATENSAGANPLNPIRQHYAIIDARKHADYVLIVVHGGPEHFQLPTPRMQETYRFFIDSGADAVVNAHQHCFSGFELYNGKPVLYGLGNLCFDNPSKKCEPWNKGYMVMLNFTKQGIKVESLYPYSQCDEQLGVHLLTESRFFYEEISLLNSIISSKSLLKEKVEEYYKVATKSFLSDYEPYGNRIANKLYRCRLLPSFFSQKRLLNLLNHIECESHLEKQIYGFKSLINK